MIHNIYLYILTSAAVSFFDPCTSAYPDPGKNQKPLYTFFPVLRTLCDACSHDVPRYPYRSSDTDCRNPCFYSRNNRGMAQSKYGRNRCALLRSRILL